MYCNEEFSIAQKNGIIISAYQELLTEKAVGDEYCWGYYLRIENNTNDKISLLGQNISVTDRYGRAVTINYNGFNGQEPILEPGECFEFEDFATSKTSAVLCGSCRILSERSKYVEDIDLPVLSLIANDNTQRFLN